VYKPICL